jgi:hypothetical protein
MSKYIIHSVFSKGDMRQRDWQELLDLLGQGYIILSAASDEYAIHYVLGLLDNHSQEEAA